MGRGERGAEYIIYLSILFAHLASYYHSIFLQRYNQYLSDITMLSQGSLEVPVNLKGYREIL